MSPWVQEAIGFAGFGTNVAGNMHAEQILTAEEFDADPKAAYERAKKASSITVLDSEGRPSMTVVVGSGGDGNDGLGDSGEEKEGG